VSKKTILLSGSLGFIATNFVHKFYRDGWNDKYRLVGIDKAVEKYNLLNNFSHPEYKFYLGDICNQHLIDNIFSLEKIDIVLHAAAYSFVCDSLVSGIPFTQSNVVGTQVLLEAAAKYKCESFFYVSTDEIYGQLPTDGESWNENTAPNPRNPYSASKLAGELMVKAAHENYKMPIIISRCCNNYGSFQPPRNLIPKIITSLLKDVEIPIHGNGKNIREWIHADDHSSAIMFLLDNKKYNDLFNIGTNYETSNLEMVEIISSKMKITPKIKFISDRASHDFRYSINCEKIKSLGWAPQISFDIGIDKAINWYKENFKRYEED
jgi:dTDP-glucose 4,6-dehydratase